MLESIILGIVLTVLTVAIHAAGISWWISRLRNVAASLPTAGIGWLLQLRVLGSTAVVLLLLHIVEVVVWAGAYLWIGTEEINTLEAATYFSTVTFTSLGYGDLVIAGSWRLLSAIESMVGLLVFGWSTATLFAVVQRIWEADLGRRKSHG